MLATLLIRIKILGFWKGVCTFILGYSYHLKNINLPLSRRLLYTKHQVILDFISKLTKNPPALKCKKEMDDNVIWVLWWQGEDNMPPIVRASVNSINKNKGDFRLQLLDSNNINDFIEIPVFIMNKVGKGMSYAHLADYIRLRLLATYGGLWIDSTFLVTSKIPGYINKYPWYTIRSRNEFYYCISNYRWAINFMYFKKGNSFAYDLLGIFESYWAQYNEAVDYFILDYSVYWLLTHNKQYAMDYSNIPYSNPECFDGLMLKMNNLFDQKEFEEMLGRTWAHKLSYRIDIKQLPNSFYSYIIDNYK